MKKDINFKLDVDGLECTIKNVPYVIMQDEECYEVDISIKLEMITKLMYEREIPNIIDFDVIKDA